MDSISSKDIFKGISGMGSFSPVVTIQEFSLLSGMTEDAVRKAAQRGYLPVFVLGQRKVMINLAKLTMEALDIPIPAAVVSTSVSGKPLKTPSRSSKRGRKR